MRISVFGMGYVGTVTAACLADQRHEVVGVDVNEHKVGLINAGQTPVIEPAIGDLIREAVRDGRLRATTNSAEAVAATELSLVCVGTPSMRSGKLDLSGVEKASQEMGEALAKKSGFHTVAIRSTILPGTVDGLVIPNIEAKSAKKAGTDFAVCYNPEFMREGTAVADFYAPPFTIIGAHDAAQAGPVTSLYSFIDRPLIHTEVRVAEMLKYICNCYHALKISFANEVGTLARALGVDSHALMQIFCMDEKLNISRAYLEPGFAFGGSCLPKDLRAITHRARELDLKLPVFEAVLPSNQLHVQRGLEMVLSTGKKKIGVLGLSFKSDTDDLRESPMIELVKALLGEGCDVKIYDAKVELSQIVGANRQFVEQTIPHIGKLLHSSLESVVAESEVIVVSRDAREFRELRELLRADHIVVQLGRSRSLDGSSAKQIGICW
ncbi:MAG TPA: nucleotide sugar dehydrogenase [Candidatus Acidoferrales bacterium]|nr:nucleotide sugar dehydrogenase [Candidatus Acidoferrales bacterium]